MKLHPRSRERREGFARRFRWELPVPRAVRVFVRAGPVVVAAAQAVLWWAMLRMLPGVGSLMVGTTAEGALLDPPMTQWSFVAICFAGHLLFLAVAGRVRHLLLRILCALVMASCGAGIWLALNVRPFVERDVVTTADVIGLAIGGAVVFHLVTFFLSVPLSLLAVYLQAAAARERRAVPPNAY